MLTVSSRLIHDKPYVMKYDMTTVTILLVWKLRHPRVQHMP